MGVSEIQFAVAMTINLMIGNITPPIGLNLMVLSAIARVDVWKITRAAYPYAWALIVVLALITYIPVFTTWLPGLFYTVK
jgi:TRAP-type C4-dicarboxylate transport system permease large subunit